MRNANVKINEENLHASSEVLRALAHPLRMEILEFIDKNKSINVNKIYSTLKLEQSITSQHLRILRNAELVEANREGKFIHYTVNYNKIAHIVKTINGFLEKKEE